MGRHNLDIMTLPNHLNICGSPLAFKIQNSFSNIIHCKIRRFFNYKDPILLHLLNQKKAIHQRKANDAYGPSTPPPNTNSMNGQYDSQRIQNQSNLIQANNEDASTDSDDREIHKTTLGAPQTIINKTNYENKSSSTTPPNTKSINNQIIANQEYKNDYSSSSESELFEDASTEYYNLSTVLEAKHKKYGNAFKGNEHQKIFKEQSLNEMCRYCFMAKWSIQHKKECLFIPEWIKNGSGKAKKLMVYSKMAIFNGWQKKNDNDP